MFDVICEDIVLQMIDVLFNLWRNVFVIGVLRYLGICVFGLLGCPQCGVGGCGSCMVRVTVDSLIYNTLELRKA